MKYKLKKEELNILKDIEGHFQDIEGIFNQLEPATQEAINNEHNEGTSLNHCLKCGSRAVAELIDNPTLQNY